mmetsp:Transcript_98091/g.211544  ORF Transcript_98091/g.211544 Transcript_98091/m.211544 type:complete len:303 (-) Transcript_98091:138-1046(-)
MADVSAQLRASLAAVPPDVQDKWRQAFQQFDRDGSGTITPEELAAVMQSLQMVPPPGEVEAMIAVVDRNHDSVIDFDEFQLMMVAAGRGTGGMPAGFSHVVERFIRMTEVARLISNECTSFVQVFGHTHRATFADIPAGDPLAIEQSPAWFDAFKMFTEQAELTMQNLLMLWGVASQQRFENDFVEAIGDRDDLLDNFLKLTEYPAFIRHMQRLQMQGLADAHPGFQGVRPEVDMRSCSNSASGAQKRLAELDQRLAELDSERNAILAERRRLVGCEVQPVTTTALKQELEMRRWKDDVGND